MTMSFGTVLLGVFCPPAYFGLRGRWIACVVHSLLYLLAVVCILSVIGFLFGVIFWFFGFAHAMWDMRVVMAEQAMQRHAELIASKMGVPKPDAP